MKDIAGNKINYLFKINEPLYLYNYGIINNSLTGGFGYTGLGYGLEYYTTGTSYSFNSNNIYLSSGSSSTNNVDISVTTNKSINTEGYSRLYITSSHNRSGCNYAYGVAAMAISEKRHSNVRMEIDINYSTYTWYYNGNNVVGTVSIDLTNFQGNYYIALFNYYSGSSNIYSVWME